MACCDAIWLRKIFNEIGEHEVIFIVVGVGKDTSLFIKRVDMNRSRLELT